MSVDSVTETTEESWLSRLGNAIKGILLGIILFVVSFPLLWWNEGRSLREAKALVELREKVVSVKPDKVDPANDKKPVHVTGEATTEETLSDPEFGVSDVAIRLNRNVAMYQWQEKKESKTEKKTGGSSTTTTTTSYVKDWSTSPVSSSSFKEPAGHENPAAMRFEGTSQSATKVALGAFTLPPSLISAMADFKPIPVTAEILAKGSLAEKANAVLENGKVYLSADGQSKPDPRNPKIGDLRISFEIVKPSKVSVIAQQSDSSFEPWQSSVPGSGSIERLLTGSFDANAMVARFQSENAFLTWGLRLGGFLLMAIGIGLVFSPLAVLADVLPILGDLTRSGIGLVAGVLAFSLSLVTIAAAWLFYRPLYAAALIAAAAAVFFLAWKLFAKKKPAQAEPAA